MTPHRIGPLLCATFLVLAGAASADQTWTTAWTPDSAPAARNNTRQEQDHSYKTNCYPCKRWDPGADSGKGTMINDPENAAPRTCPGDTTETSSRRLSGNSQDTEPNEGENDETDYACKECDGMGGLTNKPDYTPCGTCGCCENGNCVEYTNNCPHPIPDPEVLLNKVGPCLYCDIPGTFGCTVPSAFPPMPDVTICLQNCTWEIVVNSITIDYFEGLCPDNCELTIDSMDDIHAGNYCDIIAAIHDRINQGPPPPNPLPPDEVDKPPFCFSECLSTHENVHVEQLLQEWNILWPQVLVEIRNNSVEFDCQSARQESQARAQFLHSVASTMLNFYGLFSDRWNIPGRGEIPAEIAEKTCLNGYLALIEQKASDNGWPWPCP